MCMHAMVMGALRLALQSFQLLIAVKIAKKRQISADQYAKTKIQAQRYSLPSMQHDMSIYPQGRIPSIHVFRSRKQLKQSQCIEACELELQTAVHHLAEVVCTCIVLESRSGHAAAAVIGASQEDGHNVGYVVSKSSNFSLCILYC